MSCIENLWSVNQYFLNLSNYFILIFQVKIFQLYSPKVYGYFGGIIQIYFINLINHDSSIITDS